MTSTQLIPIYQNTFDNQLKQTINARDLHLFLEIKIKFADWIKARILKYEFTEMVDFMVSEKTEGLNIAQNKVDYFLTLEMAKELSMVESNDKGKEARKYFIAKEKEANEKQLTIPTTYKEALKNLTSSIIPDKPLLNKIYVEELSF
jgi:phage anti-repressor protein